MTRVGYLGVGNIGEVIAGNALAAGFDLMVYDLRQEPLSRLRDKGAKISASARELAEHAEILQISIAGDARIEAALFDAGGAIDGLKGGSIIALHSTMNPASVRRIAERAAPRGIEVIDAQVSGGNWGAKSRSLSFMIGGDPETVARCRPLFEASGKTFYYMGPVGSGASAKLAQQVMTCVNLVGVSEGLRVAGAAGLDLGKFLDMVAQSTAQSNVAERWQEQFSGLKQESADGLFEGLRPALDMARDFGIEIPLTSLAQRLIRDAFRR